MFIMKFERSTNTHKKRLPCWLSRYGLLTAGFLGFPCGSAYKESAYNVGDLGSIPGLGTFPGEGKGYLLQDSVLVAESDTTEQLSLSLALESNLVITITVYNMQNLSNNLIKNGWKNSIEIFFKEEMQMADKHMKDDQHR